MNHGQAFGEDMLRALLLGDRRPEEPEVVDAFSADPEMRRSWEEFCTTTTLLDGAAALEACILEEALEQEVPPQADEDVERTLGRLASGRGRLHRLWPRTFLAAAAAAAAAIVAWIALPFGEPSEDPAPRGFLGTEVEIPGPMSPQGEVGADALEAFTWIYAAPAGWEGQCRVVVYDEVGDELARSPDLIAPVDGALWEWRPEPELIEAIERAGSFVWQVTAESPVTNLVTSPPQAVSLDSSSR